MRAAFLIYHDILEDRVDGLFKDNGIDYYTEWEEVKGKDKNRCTSWHTDLSGL